MPSKIEDYGLIGDTQKLVLQSVCEGLDGLDIHTLSKNGERQG